MSCSTHHSSLSFSLFSSPQLINETRIVILPSINPDGRELAREKQCTSTVGMTNAHGKDLDTDFFGQYLLWLVYRLRCLCYVCACVCVPACPYMFDGVLSVCAAVVGNASQRVVEAQPETRAVMDLILERGFTLSVALDGGSLLATYPYDKPVQPGRSIGLQIEYFSGKTIK